jgi:intergrase/recombinase
VAPPKGLEPLTDWLTALRHQGSLATSFTIADSVIDSFAMFCRIDLLRSHKTIKEHVNCLKRYVKEMGNDIDATRIRDFLFKIRSKYPNPRTHRAYLCMVKVFCRDFLGKGEWVATLKFPKIKPNIIIDLPNRQQLTEFFNALPHDKAKAAFLLYCSSGLRKSEIFNAKIIPEMRAIIPTNHEQYSTKNSYVSFYNLEAEQYLKRIGFNLNVSEISIRRWFKNAYNKTKIKITPQMLREWFCSEMAILNVPDRYVDAFCGRVPRSVLAQRYTNFSVQTLKAIYDKANLTVLAQQPITVMAQ